MPFIDVRTGNARQGCHLLMSEQEMQYRDLVVFDVRTLIASQGLRVLYLGRKGNTGTQYLMSGQKRQYSDPIFAVHCPDRKSNAMQRPNV